MNLRPPSDLRLTLEELARFQSAATRHVGFSLTLACPLHCRHCIADAGPAPNAEAPMEYARFWADQLCELRSCGVELVSFTGGEALLARQQLKVLSRAAHVAGLRSGLVTSAYWARSRDAAAAVIDSLPDIDTWDFSVDEYHQEFVPLENVRTAYEVARERGRSVALRASHRVPLTPGDEAILDAISAFADEGTVAFQRVRSLGRGTQLGIEVQRTAEHAYVKPCMTQGFIIRHDGSIAPCCCSMAESREHPFQFGNACVRRLVDIRSDFLSSPLLQLMRTVGFGEVLRWVREAGLDGELPAALPEDVCDLCPILFTNPSISDELARRAALDSNRLRIAVLAERLLGEREMLRRTVKDLHALGGIEGLNEATMLLTADEVHP
jgi:pyruvate-formate lyase-activating enzyme